MASTRCQAQSLQLTIPRPSFSPLPAFDESTTTLLNITYRVVHPQTLFKFTMYYHGQQVTSIIPVLPTESCVIGLHTPTHATRYWRLRGGMQIVKTLTGKAFPPTSSDLFSPASLSSSKTVGPSSTITSRRSLCSISPFVSAEACGSSSRLTGKTITLEG